MKIIKVIVDELPEMCHDCRFVDAKNFMGTGRIWYECTILDRKVIDDVYSRPDWCPLVEEIKSDGRWSMTIETHGVSEFIDVRKEKREDK